MADTFKLLENVLDFSIAFFHYNSLFAKLN